MTRALPTEDSGREYIQFRGYQSSVTLDRFGIRFTTEHRETPEAVPNRVVHVPLPVADREEIVAGEAPRNAISRAVAEQLTEGDLRNPLVCWGVACEHVEDGETCGRVFDTPQALSGHLRAHYGTSSTNSGPGSGDGGERSEESDAGTPDTESADAESESDSE